MKKRESKRVAKIERVTSDLVKSPALAVAVEKMVDVGRSKRKKEMRGAGIVSISEFVPYGYDVERKITKKERQVVSYLSDLVYDREYATVLVRLSNPSMGVAAQWLDLGPDPWAKTLDGEEVLVRFTDPRTRNYGELTYNRKTKTIVRYQAAVVAAAKKDDD